MNFNLMRVLFLLIFSILTFCSSLKSQDYTSLEDLKNKDKNKYEEARRTKFNNPDRSLELFDEIIAKNHLFIDAYIEAGSVEYNVRRYHRALNYFMRAYEIDSLYNPKLLNSIGLSAWNAGEYENAKIFLKKYIDFETFNSESLSNARIFLRNATFAAEAIKNPVSFDPEPLGSAINTDLPEYLPSLTVDESILIFHRRVRNNEDFFISRRNDSLGWMNAVPIDDLNTDTNEGAHTLSSDGKTMYFTICGSPKNYGSCDIYVTEYLRNRWSRPENLGPEINSKAWDSQPSISSDGRFLFFSSNRANGHGGKDIYVSFKRKDGKWSVAKNIGETINSKGDEEAPFIHADGSTLYFMSDGHPGMGSSDIYLTKTEDYANWTSPVNIGYPINTKDREGAIFVTADGQTGYFSKEIIDSTSIRNLNYRPNIDIYTFEMPIFARPNPVSYLKAVVVDAKNGSPIQAEVQLRSLENNLYEYAAWTDFDGSLLVALPTLAKFGLFIEKEGYVFHSEHFSLDQSSNSLIPINKVIELVPITDENNEKDAIFVLQNVFFETNSAELDKISFIELDKLSSLLSSNPNIKVEISGHTDNVGEKEYNLNLSKERAKSVYNYLVKKGINTDRLTYIGHGDTKPVADNNTEEGRAENRRTEYRILSNN